MRGSENTPAYLEEKYKYRTIFNTVLPFTNNSFDDDECIEIIVKYKICSLGITFIVPIMAFPYPITELFKSFL